MGAVCGPVVYRAPVVSHMSHEMECVFELPRSEVDELTIEQAMELNLDDAMAKLTSDVQLIVDADVQEMTFADVYFRVYELVTGGRGEAVYAVIHNAFVRASRCVRWARFKATAKMLRAIAMYLEQVWMAQREMDELLVTAEALYARPAARHWRRVSAMMPWQVRLVKWRLAFDEVAFRPGGVSARIVSEHFAKCAQGA